MVNYKPDEIQIRGHSNTMLTRRGRLVVLEMSMHIVQNLIRKKKKQGSGNVGKFHTYLKCTL